MGILWNDAPDCLCGGSGVLTVDERTRYGWQRSEEACDCAAGRGHAGERVAEVGALGGADEPPKGAPAPIPGCPSYFETIAHDVYLSPKTIAHLRRLAGAS